MPDIYFSHPCPSRKSFLFSKYDAKGGSQCQFYPDFTNIKKHKHSALNSQLKLAPVTGNYDQWFSGWNQKLLHIFPLLGVKITSNDTKISKGGVFYHEFYLKKSGVGHVRKTICFAKMTKFGNFLWDQSFWSAAKQIPKLTVGVL